MAGVAIEGMKEVGVEVKRTEDGNELSPVEITGLVIRPMLRKDEVQRLSFTAQNIGGDRHPFYIPVKINDSLVRTDTMLLEPGEKRMISQELTVEGEGMQVISVRGIRESCKIYSRDEESVLLDLSPNEGSGDSVVIDRSGFANQGRIIRTSGQVRGEGDSVRGRLLFGKDCYIEVPNSPSLDRMGETITMMAWVYPVAGGEGLVDLFTKGDNQVLQVIDNKSLSFFAGGWGRGDCTVDLPIDWLGHWHHIAGVCEGSTLRLYIDGVQKGIARVEGRVNLSGINKWTLGRNEEFPHQRIFNGYMDKMKVYAAPLTGEEIRSITDKERGSTKNIE
jgi:hypothetical protein